MSTDPEVITAAPDDEAAAALVALIARAADAPQGPSPAATDWNSRHRNLRVPLPRGGDAWRLSLRTP